MKEVLKITLIVFSSSLLLFILSFVGATSYGYYLLKEPIKMKGLPVAVPILLDKEDWPKLEAVSYKGKNTVTVVSHTFNKDIFNAVQYQQKSEPFSELQIAKMKEIFEKYD